MSQQCAITSAPNTAPPNSKPEVKGFSSCGEGGTSFEVLANGAPVPFVAVWDGAAFVLTLSLPGCSGTGDNIVTVRVKCGDCEDDESFVISPC